MLKHKQSSCDSEQFPLPDPTPHLYLDLSALKDVTEYWEPVAQANPSYPREGNRDPYSLFLSAKRTFHLDCLSGLFPL